MASDELTPVSPNLIKQYAYDNRAYVAPHYADRHALDPDLAFSYRSYSPGYEDDYDVDIVSKQVKKASKLKVEIPEQYINI